MRLKQALAGSVPALAISAFAHFEMMHAPGHVPFVFQMAADVIGFAALLNLTLWAARSLGDWLGQVRVSTNDEGVEISWREPRRRRRLRTEAALELNGSVIIGHDAWGRPVYGPSPVSMRPYLFDDHGQLYYPGLVLRETIVIEDGLERSRVLDRIEPGIITATHIEPGTITSEYWINHDPGCET